MYRDEIWYRKLERAIGERRDSFTDKQWQKLQIDHLLKIANRVREFSNDCETCKGYQHTLNRLEEEFRELPESKAQRQYQIEQLGVMDTHFVAAHRLAPPRYFLRKWLRVGLVGGAIAGVVAMVVLGDFLLLPGCWVVVAVGAALHGVSEDQKYEREHRRI